jgi:hypothetical protein
MDIASFIAVAVAVIIIYCFLRFVVSPIIKVVFGVILFLIIIYVLQRLGFNLDQSLAPLGINLNLNKWLPNLNWIFGPANYYIDQAKNFLYSIWGNFPKPWQQ